MPTGFNHFARPGGPRGARAILSPLALAALLGLALLAGCGGPRGGSRGGTAEDSWGVTARIPADAPYIFAALSPVPDAVMQKFSATVETQLAQAHRQLLPLLAQTGAAWGRALSTFLDELRAQKPSQWWQNAGFAPGGRFAIHGLSLWPVLRLEVARQDVVQKTVQRYLELAQLQAAPARRGDWTLWQLTFDEVGVVMAVSAREALVAAMPAPLVGPALPWLLGEKRAARSLADDRALPSLMNQHSYLPYMLGVVDLQEIIAILSGRASGVAAELGKSLHLPELASCAADVDRLAALTPRVAFGYSKLDEKGMSGGFVVEMPPHVVTALRRLLTPLPTVSWPVPGRPLFAMSASLDVGNAVALFGELGQAIAQRPFGCGALTELNELGASWRQMAASPLPPVLTGLRGVSVVMEEGTAEPPSFIGYVVAVGEQLDSLTSMLALVPGLGNLSLPSDGTPAELPAAQLGMRWASSAHAALRADRLVVAVGGQSRTRAVEQMKAAPQQPAPLFGMSFDFAKVLKMSPQAAESLGGYQNLIDAALYVELRDEGLRLNVDGTW
jgi:hypothetical protein